MGLMRIAALAFAIAAFAGAQRSVAADICEALALRDVPALDDPSSILKRGELDGAITQYRVNKRTGKSSFCSLGGYCYPTHAVENGHTVEALKLTNCKVG